MQPDPAETKPARPSVRTWPQRLAWTLATLVVAFNVIAFLQAWSMTHYQPATTRTTRLGELTRWGKVQTVLLGPKIRRQSNVKTPADFALPCETQNFPGAHGANLEAWHIVGQPGTPCVLLFPGYGASKDTLLYAAREFAAFGCEQWLVDPHGIGGSEGTVTSMGFYEAEDVIAAVAQARQISPQRPLLLYGTSMGAVAILRAVHLGQVSPAALILECPFDRFAHPIGNRFVRLGLPRFPLGEAVAFWAGAQQGFNGFAHNPADYARDIHCPTLLFQGELDETVGPAYVHEVSRSLPATARTVMIPDDGHAFLVLRSPTIWRENVQRFMAENFPAPPVP